MLDATTCVVEAPGIVNLKKLPTEQSIEAVFEETDNVCTSPEIEPVTINEPVISAEPVNGKALLAGRLVNPLPSPEKNEALNEPDTVNHQYRF